MITVSDAIWRTQGNLPRLRKMLPEYDWPCEWKKSPNGLPHLGGPGTSLTLTPFPYHWNDRLLPSMQYSMKNYNSFGWDKITLADDYGLLFNGSSYNWPILPGISVESGPFRAIHE